MNDNNIHYRQNKSFARRIGKSLSPRQKDLLEQKLPSKTFSQENFAVAKNTEIALEIGFGMGEHFSQMIIDNRDKNKFFIGAEVYLNGVVRVLDNLPEADNFSLWPDDINLLLQKLPLESISIIYVLFPDPWPKNREKKRRLLQKDFIQKLLGKLKTGGKFVFASDIADYFGAVADYLSSLEGFSCSIYQEGLPAAYNYTPTKYHQKATLESRPSQFLIAQKTP